MAVMCSKLFPVTRRLVLALTLIEHPIMTDRHEELSEDDRKSITEGGGSNAKRDYKVTTETAITSK